jgi:hypothetical protein
VSAELVGEVPGVPRHDDLRRLGSRRDARTEGGDDVVVEAGLGFVGHEPLGGAG